MLHTAMSRNVHVFDSSHLTLQKLVKVLRDYSLPMSTLSWVSKIFSLLHIKLGSTVAPAPWEMLHWLCWLSPEFRKCDVGIKFFVFCSSVKFPYLMRDGITMGIVILVTYFVKQTTKHSEFTLEFQQNQHPQWLQHWKLSTGPLACTKEF